jgi:hypothetical protein
MQKAQLFFTNMSLLKIPLILLSAAALQVSLTPPNPSSTNEVVRNTSNERTLLLLIKYGLPYAKVHTIR